MKVIFNLIVALTLYTGSGYAIAGSSEGLADVQDFRIEAKESKQKQVPILVLFMSSYCPYCEVALHDFLLPMHRNPEYDNKVILRQLDINSKEKLIDFQGKITTPIGFANASKIWAVPTVMLFDSEGHELTNIAGLLTVDFYRAYLDTAISESQEKMRIQSH